jgi:transposase-like protein
MGHKRTFTPEFKKQVVLDIISGRRSSTDVCRQHNLKP